MVAPDGQDPIVFDSEQLILAEGSFEQYWDTVQKMLRRADYCKPKSYKEKSVVDVSELK